MLLGFKVDNYKSFGSIQEFTMVPGRIRSNEHHVIRDKNYNALKFAVLYGGNASGKSNFIQAIGMFQMILRSGFVPKTMRSYSFRLTDNIRTLTDFEIEFAIKSKVYAYGIKVDLQNGLIANEYLYDVTGKEKKIFDLNEEEKVNTSNLKSKDISRINIYISDLKENELLINKLSSANVSDNIFFDNIKEIFFWLTSLIVVINPNSKPINILSQFHESNEVENIQSVIDILRSFDTGITNYDYKKLNLDSFLGDLGKKTSMYTSESVLELKNVLNNLKLNEIIEINISGEYYRARKNSDEETYLEQLSLEHCNFKDARFSFDEESDGTMRLIELVNVLYQSQFSDVTYVIDELDRSLHPNLTASFIRKFLENSVNNRSQLIITTHETNIMDLDLLRRDEIWLIERDYEGKSNLIPLNTYDIRKDKIIDKDYLDGRYGGVPVLNNYIMEDANGKTYK